MDPGLCRDCRHAKVLRNDRASVFYLCGLADKDARFTRYPRLPVHACKGYEKEDPARATSHSDTPA